MYYVYMVACADNTLYTGITTDLDRRMTEHNTRAAGARYTKARRPVRLVYHARFRTRSRAQQEEARIKSLTRAAKIALINIHASTAKKNRKIHAHCD